MSQDLNTNRLCGAMIVLAGAVCLHGAATGGSDNQIMWVIGWVVGGLGAFRMLRPAGRSK